MRGKMPPKMLGSTPVEKIYINTQSRDQIPKILLGLQQLYSQKKIRAKIFLILEKAIPENTDRSNGRPGMDLWTIFVMAILRLSLNCDYDHLHELMHQHDNIRLMLGYGPFNKFSYGLQTVKDNFKLLTPEILVELNKVIVQAGHEALGVLEKPLKTRADSFVVKTDVHFPTDINLLYDAVRKSVELSKKFAESCDLQGWREVGSLIKKLKKLLIKINRYRKRKSKNPLHQEELDNLYKEYIELAQVYLERCQEHVLILSCLPNVLASVFAEELEKFISMGDHQIDLIRRRIFEGEQIPHQEKIFSLFEPHTEWINKGKSGVICELGLRVSVVEDPYGFILAHKVMQQQTDSDVAYDLVKDAKKVVDNLYSVSFDKGYWSKENYSNISAMVPKVILPKKGKLSKKDKEVQSEKEWHNLRQHHNGVESCINGLDHHGLDRCPDHGLDGFKRYVAVGLISRNIQTLGANLFKKLQKRKRSKKTLACKAA